MNKIIPIVAGISCLIVAFACMLQMDYIHGTELSVLAIIVTNTK